jgi:hypothetical protein
VPIAPLAERTDAGPRGLTMQYTPKPHVSPALAQLRSGITVCALVICACAVFQMLVFGFVHFTQVRFVHPKDEPARQALSVVVGAPARPAMSRAGRPQEEQETALIPLPRASRTLSDTDATLHVLSDMAVIAGIIATFMLSTLVGLGVVVAAGGGVPGAERAVSAMCWSLLLALACLPWREVFVAVPYPGVFGAYDDMTAMSNAVDGGAVGTPRLLVLYLLMPIAAFGASVLVLYRFRAGVAEGVIVTSVNELDERLEREMATIRTRGVANGMSRSVGALNQAIGEAPAVPAVAEVAAPSPQVPLPRRPVEAPEPKSGRSWLTRRDRRIGEPDAGDGLRRPL